MSTVLTPQILEAMSRRRAEGERVSVLAGELGIPWQKLDKAMRHGMRTAIAGTPPAGLLTERYRPRSLEELVGQEQAVALLRRFAHRPYPCAFLFEGETGTGKSSAALALAAELGCAVVQQELGGVHIIASGEQSADAVRATCEVMHRTPFYGSGWKLILVNEADRMNSSAETIWLDRLECIPAHCVVIFTTNHPQRLSQRFRDRCIRVMFESDSKSLLPSAVKLLTCLWNREVGSAPDVAMIRRMAQEAVEDGKLSFRRAVQILQRHPLEGGRP